MPGTAVPSWAAWGALVPLGKQAGIQAVLLHGVAEIFSSDFAKHSWFEWMLLSCFDVITEQESE